MESDEVYGIFERALLDVGIQQEKIDGLERKTPIKDVLETPFQLFRVLRSMGVPLEKYFKLQITPTSPKSVIRGKLSQKGVERIIQTGEYVGNVERARVLAEAGGENGSLASFYSYLNAEDILNAGSYELVKVKAA